MTPACAQRVEKSWLPEGGSETVMVRDALEVPLDPVQEIVNVLVLVSALMVWVPEVDLAPAHPPEAVQDVALVDDHVSVKEPPLVIDVGFAVRDTVGKGTADATVVKFQT
jgi:hypothetical protein